MRKNNIKKIVSLALTLAMVLGLACFTYGDTISDRQQDLSDVNKQIEEAQKEVDKNKKKITSLTKDMTALEERINNTDGEIKTLTANINNVKEQIQDKLVELSKLQESMTIQTDELNARLRAMYKNGNAGMLSVLLHSTSMSDLITNIEMAKRIYTSDSNLLLKMRNQYDAIYQTKLELSNMKTSLLSQQDELNEKKASLKEDEAELSKQKNAISKDNKELESQLDLLTAEANALTAQIRALQSGGDYTGGLMCWPSKASKRITEYYGMRMHPIYNKMALHTGIDIGANGGTDILAAAAGTVITAGYNANGYGNYVMIDHGGKVVTLYGHARKLLVKKGDVVKRGQVIGLVGTTGLSTGNHIHFEIRINGEYQDPLDKNNVYFVEPGVYYYD